MAVEIKNVKIEKGIVYFATVKNQVAQINFNTDEVFGVSGKKLITFPEYMLTYLTNYYESMAEVNDDKTKNILYIMRNVCTNKNSIHHTCTKLLTLDKMYNMGLSYTFMRSSYSCEIDFTLLAKAIKWAKEQDDINLETISYNLLIRKYKENYAIVEFNDLIDKSPYKDLISVEDRTEFYKNYYISDAEYYSLKDNNKKIRLNEITNKYLNIFLHWIAHEEFFGWNFSIFNGKKCVKNISTYFEACELLEVKPEKKNPCKHICQMDKAYNDYMNREQDKILLEKYNRNFEKFFYENDKYTVIMPKTTKEFITEGNILNNCLGWNNYAGKVAKGECIVLFVRKKKNIDKAYVTMDLHYRITQKKWAIDQYYTYNNTLPTDLTFKYEYQNFLNAMNE